MATYVRTQTDEHAIGARGRLALKLTSGGVDVRGVDGREARLRATFEIRTESEVEAEQIFEDALLRVDRGETSLRVEEPGEGPAGLGGAGARLLGRRGSVQLHVEVEVPRAAEVRVETVSGDVTVEGTRGEQRYTTVSGDLFMTDLGGALRISSISGDAVLRASQPLALRTEAVSGDVSLAAPRIESLRAQGVSGDIAVEGELARGGEFQVETVSGDLAVALLGGATFEVRGLSTEVSSELDHRVEGRLDRRRVVVGEGGATFTFRSMSGDLAIHRARRVAPLVDELPGLPPTPTDVGEAEQLAVLQALERGEIDVDEAARRLGGGFAGGTDE